MKTRNSARPVQYHFQFVKLEKALDELERDGAIEKIEYSRWASPTVPVLKPDKSVRICGDYAVTINKESECEHYPLPSLDELREKLAGGSKFTKLDLSQAYHQLELDEASKCYTTISTHRGLYQYTRLPSGISSAVSIFQRTIEGILSDYPKCIVYRDDILVTGANGEIHMENLQRVLQRLQDVGLKLKQNKN